MNTRYRAFICYSQQDATLAARLHRRLESYRVPRRLAGTEGRHGLVPASLAPVFRDRDELAASADIGERLHDALARSEFLIVLCSPAAAQSRWVNAEIETFCALRPANRDRVLAVLLAGEPGSGDAATECFPSALRPQDITVAAKGLRYPLAADFRPGRDRPRDAELRLIASLLGVGFDVLKQREQERRIGRLRISLAVAVSLTLAFAALAAYAYQQRAEARAAAQAAATSATRATSARSEAEKLIEFMLKDLRPSLEVIGKLELLEPANEKVRAYYATVAPGEMDGEMLRRQGLAFHAYAVDLRSHKRGAKTLTILETAALLRRRVIELTPRDVGAWQDLAETHRYMALQRRDDGDINGALREIGEARRLAQKGLDLEPGNLKSAARVASLPNDEGEMLMRAGRTAEARPVLESALRQLEGISSREPKNLEFINRASGAAWQLGNVHRRLGDFAQAEPVYRRGLELAERLCAAEPANIFYLRRREQASGTLGQSFLEAGRYEEAVAQLAANLVFTRGILASDPKSLVYQDGLATNLGNLAEAEHNLGREAAARAHIRECVGLREGALASGATDVRSRSTLAYALATWSGIESKAARHNESAVQAKRGVVLMEELCRANPADLRLADDFAFLRSKLAQAILAGGKFDEAEQEYRAALTQIDAVIAREPANPQLTRWRDRASWQLGLGSALIEAGRVGDARPILEACVAEFTRLERAGLPEATYAVDRRQAADLLARVSQTK